MLSEEQYGELARWLRDKEGIEVVKDEIVGTMKTLEYYIDCWGDPHEIKALDGGAESRAGPRRRARGLKAHVQPPRRSAGHGRWGCGNRGFVRKTLAGHDAYSFYRGTKRTDGQCAA